jgi:hypothetical protein
MERYHTPSGSVSVEIESDCFRQGTNDVNSLKRIHSLSQDAQAKNEETRLRGILIPRSQRMCEKLG